MAIVKKMLCCAVITLIVPDGPHLGVPAAHMSGPLTQTILRLHDYVVGDLLQVKRQLDAAGSVSR